MQQEGRPPRGDHGAGAVRGAIRRRLGKTIVDGRGLGTDEDAAVPAPDGIRNVRRVLRERGAG